MKLGAGSYLFRYAVGNERFRPENPMDPVALVEKCAELGFELVQFAENLPLDQLDHAGLEQLRLTAEKLNITLEAGTAGASRNRLMHYLDIARRIDADLVRMTLHGNGISPTEAEAVETLRHVLPHYREAGVHIAIENHFMIRSEALSALVSSLNDPHIGICLDTANSIAQHEWPLETVQLLAEHCISLHLKDYKLTAHPDGIGVLVQGAPIGEGQQNIPEILRLLKARHKDVNIILEQWLPPAETMAETLANELQWIRSSVAYARKLQS